MIEARGISKRFGDLQVLSHIDLDIRQGVVTTIVGREAECYRKFH